MSLLALLVFFPTHPIFLKKKVFDKVNLIAAFNRILQESQQTKPLTKYDCKMDKRF